MLWVFKSFNYFLYSFIYSLVQFPNFSQLVKRILVLSHRYLLQFLPYTPFLTYILHLPASLEYSTSVERLIFPWRT